MSRNFEHPIRHKYIHHPRSQHHLILTHRMSSNKKAGGTWPAAHLLEIFGSTPREVLDLRQGVLNVIFIKTVGTNSSLKMSDSGCERDQNGPTIAVLRKHNVWSIGLDTRVIAKTLNAPSPTDVDHVGIVYSGIAFCPNCTYVNDHVQHVVSSYTVNWKIG